MKKIMVLCALALVLSGCAHRHAHFVKDGLLRQGIHSQAFLEVWGEPDRIATVSAEETTSAGWSLQGGRFFKGRRTLVKWTYEKIGIELFFSGTSLRGWETDRSVRELKLFAN